MTIVGARHAAAGQRVRLSVVAALAGWFAASCATLPFQAWELLRNAEQGHRLAGLLDGCALWFGFTLLVVAAVWVLLVLALALLVPQGLIVRRSKTIALMGAIVGLLVLYHRLGLWEDLQNPGPESPFKNYILQMYSVFTVVFAGTTSLVYSRLLRSAARPLER